MRMSSSLAAAVVLLTGTCMVATSRADNSRLDLEAAVVSGRQAPGLDPGVRLGSVSAFGLNDAGGVGFSAVLFGPGVDASNFLALFAPTATPDFRLAARAGDSIDGLPDTARYASSLASGSFPKLNDHGEVSFASRIDDPSFDDGGLPSVFGPSGMGTPRVVVRPGTQVPDLASGVAYSFPTSEPTLNNSGDVAVLALIEGPGIPNGRGESLQFVSRSGQTRTLARAGGVAVGLADGTTYTRFNSGRLRLNDAGESAVIASTRLADGTSSNSIVTLTRDGVASAAASFGEQAAGLTTGVRYSLLTAQESLQLNNAGEVAFYSRLFGTGVDATNDFALFAPSQDGGLTAVARKGDHAPGFADGVLLERFTESTAIVARSVALNDAGQVAFRARVVGDGITDANNAALFGPAGDDRLTLIAQEGTQAMGFGAGYTYDQLELIEINNLGQTAFVARVTDGVDLLSAIYATDTDGTLSLVAAEGDEVNVSLDPLVDDIRTIRDIARRFEFNNLGQVAVTVSFTDSSSAVLVATIPTPSGLPVLALTWMLTGRRRR